MSHTAVLDEAERERRLVNHLNEILRHCRIGRVKMKLVSGHGRILVPQAMPKRWMPDPMKPAPTPFFSGGTGDVPLVPSHGVLM